MGSRPRASVLALAVLSTLVSGGCGWGSGSAAQAADPCTATVSTPAQAVGTLSRAGPGSRVCVTGGGLRDADLVVDRSGQAGRPLLLSGDGAQVRSVTVSADHVVVQGLTTVDGEGIVLRGRDLVARRNDVRDASNDGISCGDVCADVVIKDNTVTRADGTGIIVEGQRIAVRHNDVSGSVKRRADDADGIRFFGTDVTIADNTVRDIKHSGYRVDPPHTDCFQTYDNGRIPTVNAVITGNVCRNVDDQCLIATAEKAGDAGMVGRSRGILFSGNRCDVGASQAVLVRWFPQVRVQDDVLEGPDLARAAIFLDGSTGCRFSGNTVPPSVTPYEIDGTSTAGFSTG